MLVLLLMLVEIYHLLYELMYLPATDKGVESFFRLLFFCGEKGIVLFNHLIIGETASNTGRVESTLEDLNQLSLRELTHYVFMHIFLFDFGRYCRLHDFV